MIRMKNKKKKAIFLDRDGVLIRDSHLITKWDQVEIIEGSSEALSILKELGYLLFIISNQSVVARGMLSEQECNQLHGKIMNSLDPKKLVEESYLCPYHPDAQISKYRRDHPWRKPSSGALKDWIDRYQIDPIYSFMIGDRVSDIICGNDVGCQSVLIGEGISKYTKNVNLVDENPTADHRFNSLSEFVTFLQAKI